MPENFIPELSATRLLPTDNSVSAAMALLQQVPAFSSPSFNLPMLGMQLLIATWIFVLGTCFGSFLNVVIYRLPAGLSLGRPKSRCPRCETPLAARDNIPILGWLLLRGRCRYCQLPIAVRYPLIETVCGAVFLALLFGELLTGASNLPLRHPDHFHVNPGFWLVWFAKWDLTGIYLFHCLLLTTVLALTMIGYDGHPPVRKLQRFGVLSGLLPGTLWFELRPVRAAIYSNFLYDLNAGFRWPDPLSGARHMIWTGVTAIGFLDGFIGLAAGFLAGSLVKLQMRTANGTAPPSALAISSAFVVTGVFLGWQAVGMLLLLTLPVLALAAVLVSPPDESRLKYAAPGFFVLLLIFLLTWQKLECAAWMIGISGFQFSPLTWWQDWLLTLGGLSLLAAVTGAVRSRTPGADADADQHAPDA
ncbi:MAG: prepilin peptidase [Fuerstiella sp.]